MRPHTLVTLALASLLGLIPIAATAAVPRTLVLRGVVTEADGKPIPGARVSVRGSATLSTLSGQNGRYALDVVMGTGAGLARGPFRVEVRAELNGKRLGLVGGGAALVTEVVLLPGSPARCEVRSNSELAVAAIATSFAQESITHAWVQADFGGGASASGSSEMRYRDSVPLPGTVPTTPAPVAKSPPPPPAVNRSTPAPVVKPTPTRQPTPVAPPAIDRDASARAAVRRDSARLAIALQRSADSLAAAERRTLRAARRAAAKLVERARLDSLAQIRAEQRRADSLAWTVRQADAKQKPARKPARSPKAPKAPKLTGPGIAVALADSAQRQPSASRPVTLAPRDTTRLVDTAPPPSDVADVRVKRIEPFEEPRGRMVQDTCACRVRGTVEVAWPRPLEEGLPILLTLEGPALQRTEVTLDMGAPREFRLGPLPCGEYRLRVQPQGRMRYALQRGGDTMRVFCDGHTQVRVVLVPVKK